MINPATGKNYESTTAIDTKAIVQELALTTDISKFEDYLINLQMNYFERGEFPEEHKADCIYYFNHLREHLKKIKHYQQVLEYLQAQDKNKS